MQLEKRPPNVGIHHRNCAWSPLSYSIVFFEVMFAGREIGRRRATFNEDRQRSTTSVGTLSIFLAVGSKNVAQKDGTHSGGDPVHLRTRSPATRGDFICHVNVGLQSPIFGAVLYVVAYCAGKVPRICDIVSSPCQFFDANVTRSADLCSTYDNSHYSVLLLLIFDNFMSLGFRSMTTKFAN